MSKTIRIGTRDSELALWQAKTVEKQLNDLGYNTEIIAVKSDGDIVLDTFSGTSTTAIACLETNRKFICIERDENYYEISKNRIESFKQTNNIEI